MASPTTPSTWLIGMGRVELVSSTLAASRVARAGHGSSIFRLRRLGVRGPNWFWDSWAFCCRTASLLAISSLMRLLNSRLRLCTPTVLSIFLKAFIMF